MTDAGSRVVVDLLVTRAATSLAASPLARAVLRAEAARRLGVPDAAVVIEQQCAVCGARDHGRPTVRDAPFDVSLAHSGPVAVVAVSPGPRVGVDVELARPRRLLERLAARTFDPAALAAWQALPEVARPPAFLRGWTAKEAYLKAIGVGLALPLREVDERPRGWTTVLLDAAVPDGIVAVAVEAPGASVVVADVDPVSLSPGGARR